MNAYPANHPNNKRKFRKPKIDWSLVCSKLWASRKIILTACGMGAILGVMIAFSTPKEYTARIFVAPEGYSRNSTSGLDALSALAGIQSKPSTDRDAIYPSLYPLVIRSTPFLTQLFDIKVRPHKDSTALTLARYLKEQQQTPWWRTITSLPFRLVSQTAALWNDTATEKKEKTNREINPFRLTKEQARLAGAIASRIEVEVDKEKRTIALLITMQNPLVAATVADSVSAHLQAYITTYRTSKARRILKYNEQLCKEAKAAYYAAQEKYTHFADANQDLVKFSSRAQLVTLRTELDLAFAVYNQLDLQVKLAKERVERTTPIYAVIEPVTVPTAPSKPQSTRIVALWILLGFMGGVGWVLLKVVLTTLSARKSLKIEAHKR